MCPWFDSWSGHHFKDRKLNNLRSFLLPPSARFAFYHTSAAECAQPPISPLRTSTTHAATCFLNAILQAPNKPKYCQITIGTKKTAKRCFTGLGKVPREGVEPSRYCYRRILSPLRLPIPPSRHIVRRLFVGKIVLNHLKLCGQVKRIFVNARKNPSVSKCRRPPPRAAKSVAARRRETVEDSTARIFNAPHSCRSRSRQSP